jgi:parallel beta-helix repeat protein
MRRAIKLYVPSATCAVLLALGGTAVAQQLIYVDDDDPADFKTIQAAIDDAKDGDVVVVKPGTYTGDGNRDIDFKGKAITVRSENGPENCVIDCDGTESDPHRGFYFHNGEGVDSVVQGFTITNGYGQKEQFGDYLWSFGGGIYCIGSGPSISNCIITGNSAIQGAGIFAWKNSSPKIVNCTVRGNLGRGGIYCWRNTTATITDCVIFGNESRGIYCWDSSAIILNCMIRNNEMTGIELSGEGSWLIDNCVIFDNHDSGIWGLVKGAGTATISNCVIKGNNNPVTPGGGIRISTYDEGTAKITNCTITGNRAVSRFGRVNPGGGISCTSTGDTVITNSILWNNVGGDIYLCNFAMPPNGDWTTEPTELTVSYSRPGIIFVQEDRIFGDPVLTLGPGNVDVDPCFAEPGYWDQNGTPEDANDDFWVNGDYHLKSQAGRWDPETQSWVQDDVTSPCIDAGDPMSPIGHEVFPNGGIINIGAYGGTAEASKSYFGEPVCETIVAGDINGDCKVDWADFTFLALHWLQDNSP